MKRKMTELEKMGFRLPDIEGYCACYRDSNGKQRKIPDSERKTYKAAQRIADEYMLINQVQTYVIECIF